MRQVAFSAMGTEVVATVADDDDARAVAELFEEVESVASRFRPTSELSAVNACTVDEVNLSPLLASLLRAADDLRCRTGGLVDAGVGSAVRAWGYDRTFTEVCDGEQAPRPVAEGGWWEIGGATLRRSRGTLLDLGGVAKGWTADAAVEGGLAAIVSAGGDVRSEHPDTEVEIVDPWGVTAATVRLGRGALATSSTTRRRWKMGARQAHHLIDPRTGAPADTPVLSATVVAATAVEAEAGAKAVLLVGADGLAWAEAQPWIRSALVVWHDGSVYATTGLELAA